MRLGMRGCPGEDEETSNCELPMHIGYTMRREGREGAGIGKSQWRIAWLKKMPF